MSKGATTPPTCRICGVAHWLREPHVFGGRVSMPDLMSPRPGSARERQMIDVTPPKDTLRRPGKARKAPGGSAPSDGIAGLKQEGVPLPPPKSLDVARAALAEAERPKPKRKGRPATGFDKKAYDRQRAAERRAAAKAAKT